MDIPVQTGQWVAALMSLMTQASDGDCFLLPSPIHLVAYEQAAVAFPSKKFKVKVTEEAVCQESSQVKYDLSSSPTNGSLPLSETSDLT